MTALVIGGGVAGAAAAHVCLDAVVLEGGDRVEHRPVDGVVLGYGHPVDGTGTRSRPAAMATASAGSRGSPRSPTTSPPGRRRSSSA